MEEAQQEDAGAAVHDRNFAAVECAAGHDVDGLASIPKDEGCGRCRVHLLV